MLRPFIIILFFLFANVLLANDGDFVFQKADSLIFEDYIKQYGNDKEKPINELMVSTAKYFSGKPYVASTLEIGDKENLVINLREFDCTTLVENCIALSFVIKSDDLSFDNYCQILKNIRYRNGEIDGYISRLHYTSDWIYENQKSGLLKNITLEIGGKVVQKPVNFMSSHSHLYKHLKDNTQNIKELKKIEQNINKRYNFAILSVSDIERNKDKIKNGDIIAFSTSVAGLDYSHIGIACWQNNDLHFIHASSRQKEVVLEKKTLTNYCKNSKSCTGISILRLID